MRLESLKGVVRGETKSNKTLSGRPGMVQSGTLKWLVQYQDGGPRWCVRTGFELFG